MKKKVLSILVIICMLIPNCIHANASGRELNSDELDVVNKIEEIISANFGNIQGEYVLGDPICISNVDSNSKYYLVSVNRNQTNIATIEINEIGEVSLTNDISLYREVLSLVGADCLIYTTGGVVYADFNESVVELFNSRLNIAGNSDFESLSYNDKQNYVETILNNDLSNLNLSNIISSIDNICVIEPSGEQLGVVPSTEANTLSISNFVQQGNYNICWAACVATIVNYKKSRSLSATTVASAMNHNYTSSSYSGATATETVSALSYYGLTYSKTNSKISWTSVKSNISSNAPFIVCISNSSGGHMLVGYGYSCKSGDAEAYSSSRYVNVWDPNGYKRSFQYNASTYSLYGYSWTWNNTIVD